MLIIILILTTIFAITIWHFFVENTDSYNFVVPPSRNQSFSQPIAINPDDIVAEIDENIGTPILLYLYTTWCASCKKQTPIINEISRKFQETKLHVISVAIDKNVNEYEIHNHLKNFGKIYFSPKFLLYSNNLVDLLATKNIHHSGYIPLTVLIDKNGRIAMRFTGSKSQHYIEKRIIKNLKKLDDN